MPWTRDKKKKFRLTGIILIPLVGAFSLYLLRDPLADLTRSWRSSYSLNKAKSALAEVEEWEEAYQLALVARQLNPQSLEALRVLVDASFKTRSIRTLDYANALFLNPKATPDDKLLVLSILQQAGDHIGFVRLYNILPRELRQEKGFVTVRVQFLIQRNAFAAAREILEAELSQDRDRQFLLLLASLLLQPSSSEADIQRGQKIISELAATEDSDEIARTAFQLLGYIRPDRIDPSLFGNLGIRAEESGKDSIGAYIAAANLALAAANDPNAKEAIIERAIQEQGSLAPAQLAAWLQRVGETDDILSFLTPERSANSPDLYQQRFLALIRAGKIDEADEWLDNPPRGIESINIWLARAQLSRAQNERAEENNAWEQAFQVAEVTAHRNEFLRIFEVASSTNRIDLATRALLKAPTHPTGILPPAAELVGPMRFLTNNERIEDLRFLTEALVVREPDNVILLNNLVYLNLILDDNFASSMETARNLIEANPGILSLQTTYAMGFLLKKEPSKAMEVLPPGDSVAWETATAADLAIRARTLELSGFNEQAADVWKQVDSTELTAVERKLFFPPEEEIPNPRVKKMLEDGTTADEGVSKQTDSNL